MEKKMSFKKKVTGSLLLMLLAFFAAACGSTEPAAEVASGSCETTTPVRLQLQWVTQSQFAGYYAALAEGYYDEMCLDVTILEGAVEIVPQQVVASGEAEFGVAWVPKMLASREQGVDLVNIAQIFQRSGTLQVSWADSGISSPADWAGKRVGTWGFGNEFEVYAALRQAGIEPDNASEVTIVQQPFDMSLLLNREIDAAQAMTYNEYAQVLESVNPETGELYQPEDLTVINYEDVGTAMLQDHVFANADYLAANEAVAIDFLAATFKGWMFCRDEFETCVNHVLDSGPTLGEGHMTWQLNEINSLIWPSPAGIGVMDADAWQQTVDISVEFAVLGSAPSDGAYRTDLAEAALAKVSGDTKGSGYTKATVEVVPGGE
ncbi:MAG: NitT/TauT family transport system substrate-binding protein [Cellvibrionaceae bacterium]